MAQSAGVRPWERDLYKGAPVKNGCLGGIRVPLTHFSSILCRIIAQGGGEGPRIVRPSWNTMHIFVHGDGGDMGIKYLRQSPSSQLPTSKGHMQVCQRCRLPGLAGCMHTTSPLISCRCYRGKRYPRRVPCEWVATRALLAAAPTVLLCVGGCVCLWCMCAVVLPQCTTSGCCWGLVASLLSTKRGLQAAVLCL